jgi:flagellar hook protein FlgE
MPSFSIPLSGLQADSTALNTIANNLSNMNTTAFKSQSTSFSDLFYQQLGVNGANDPLQVGGGTQVAVTTTNFGKGSVSSDGVNTHMAIDGDNGFFVVRQNGLEQLTRDGSFTLDSNGNLITSSGQSVMGFPVVNGVVNTSGALVPINIPTSGTDPATATTTFSVGQNLDPTTAVGGTATSNVTVYDSLGSQHQLTITYTKTGSNAWSYQEALDGSTTGGGTGTLTFSGSGALSGSTSTTANSFVLANGATTPFAPTWTVAGTGGNTLTQTTGSSNQSSSTQNGFTSGQFSSFSVDSSGNIVVTYTNNDKKTVGQVAIGTVPNEQGLVREGGDTYSVTQASGAITFGTAGTSGRGQIRGSSLEGSNVDTSTEFANLIVAQRAFQANSKTVTTFDSITQSVINMVSGQ